MVAHTKRPRIMISIYSFPLQVNFLTLRLGRNPFFPPCVPTDLVVRFPHRQTAELQKES